MAFSVGIPLVEKFDLMDVANPYEIFSWMGAFGFQASVTLIGHQSGAQVTSFNGIALTTHACFDDPMQLDLLFVPGGGNDYISNATSDARLLQFVSDQAKNAKHVASVCTGAFVLAQAGLLDGIRATTHWMFLEQFQQRYPKVLVVNGYPRYSRDGRFMTGGGISSGVDESLTLVGEIAGPQVGKDIELAIQYRPQPPWGVGDPSVADYKTWKEVTTDLGG